MFVNMSVIGIPDTANPLPAEPSPLSKDEFAHLALTMLESLDSTMSLRYDPEAFAICAPFRTYNLYNLYQTYILQPSSELLDALLRKIKFLACIHSPMPDEFVHASHDLLPLIHKRPVLGVSEIRTTMADKASGIVAHADVLPFGDHFAVKMAYDMPTYMCHIDSNHLQHWNVTFEDAHSVAMKNLAAITTTGLRSLAPGVWISHWDDGYAASRILLLDMIRRHPVKGKPVVMMLSWDLFLLTGSEDREGLSKAVAHAMKHLHDPNPIFPIALILTGDTWVPFLPDKTHPEFRILNQLQQESAAMQYERQLTMLENQLGSAIQVARQMLFTTSPPVTLCTLCTFEKTLLPEADFVGICHKDKDYLDLGMVRWKHFMAALGDQLVPQGCYPERYYVNGTVSEDALKALKTGEATQSIWKRIPHDQWAEQCGAFVGSAIRELMGASGLEGITNEPGSCQQGHSQAA